MTASTSRFPVASALSAGWLGLAVGLSTALVFLLRAADPGQANWPVTWELRSSDNGVLFQVLHDVFAGRTLDWSFSPQVYVFPELPISALAYLISGASVYWYYLWVAVINNVVLALCLFALSAVILPAHTSARWALRAGVASVPLVVFPLIGTTWLMSFHLAPTYYFGMYAALLIGPVAFFTRRRWVRLVVGIALALTIASNPLTLVFAGAGILAVLLLLALRRRWSELRRVAIGLGAMGVLAFAVRMLVFTPLQGTSPLTYIDPEIFERRLSAADHYFRAIMTDRSVFVVLLVGAVLAVACLVGAIISAVRVGRGAEPSHPLLAAIYLGLVPIGGIAATAALMVTHYYYFWPALIAPFVLVLLTLPDRWLEIAVGAGAVLLLTVALVTAPWSSIGPRYFGYRSAETICIDNALQAGDSVGYATFSDARRLALTSQHPFRLIPILAEGEPNVWLANRSTVTEETGTFFYINEHGDELPIDVDTLVERFGEPDSTTVCGEGQSILSYTDAESQARIAEFYGVRPQ